MIYSRHSKLAMSPQCSSKGPFMFLNVPHWALNLSSSWVTLRDTPDPLHTPGHHKNQPKPCPAPDFYQFLVPQRVKQFCLARPLVIVPCPSGYFETASLGIQEFREHHTPGNLYLIKAVSAASRIFVIVLPGFLIPQVRHPCRNRIVCRRHYFLLLGLFFPQLGPRR
jgi:hypothetical protein